MVHADLSCRAGSPVLDLERIVSEDVACSIFPSQLDSFCFFGSSAIPTHHTPWAPKVMLATICLPRPIPPAPSTRTSPTASTISGIRTIDPISPVCPPASYWQ